MNSAGGPNPPIEGMLEVGRVLKPHGLGGELSVQMLSDRPERVAPGATYLLVSTIADPGRENDPGPIEVTVESSRRHQQRWLLRFEGCNSKEDAERFRGHTLWGHRIDDPDELWVHDLIGSRVLDQAGVDRGEVVSVHQNPASDLLELADGRLVPVVFVVDGPRDGEVVVEVPDGLFDL